MIRADALIQKSTCKGIYTIPGNMAHTFHQVVINSKTADKNQII